jgi:hypothetical protein
LLGSKLFGTTVVNHNVTQVEASLAQAPSSVNVGRFWAFGEREKSRQTCKQSVRGTVIFIHAYFSQQPKSPILGIALQLYDQISAML